MPGIWDGENGAFVTFIRDQTTITELIGAGTSCRCWLSVAPQKVPTTPYMIFARSGGERYAYHGGISGRRVTASIWTYGATPSAAHDLMEKLIDVLTDFRGSWSGAVIMRCEVLMAPEDGFDNPVENSDSKRFWCRVPVAVTHEDS